MVPVISFAQSMAGEPSPASEQELWVELGQLWVDVVDMGDLPYPNLTVALVASDGNRMEAKTDASGRAGFARVTKGTYALTVSKKSVKLHSMLEVPAGREMVIRKVFIESTYEYVGGVVRQENKPSVDRLGQSIPSGHEPPWDATMNRLQRAAAMLDFRPAAFPGTTRVVGPSGPFSGPRAR